MVRIFRDWITPSKAGGKRGKRQIVYGLLCAGDGCPVAIEVFAGSTADPATLSSQVVKLKERFALDHVVLVGDRGMITQARISEDLKSAGLDWITALRAPAIKALLEGGALQMSLFDDRDIVLPPRKRGAGITSPDFPGERLIVCRNRALAGERARKREDLLTATERDLARIAAAVVRKRQPLHGKAAIGLEIGAVLDKHKMAKHFALDITDTSFTVARKTDEITREAALDGLYVVRTSLPATALDDTATVRRYKSLVERAFRCIKTVDLQIRPVYHWLADRVRARVLSACSPTTWNGICASAWRPCSTTTPTRRPPKRNAPASSPKPSAPPLPSPSKPPDEPRTVSRSTASAPFSTISPR